MKIFETFTKHAPYRVFASVVIGALAGLAYAMLIPIVVSSFPSEVTPLASSVEDSVTVGFFEVTHYKFATIFFFVCAFVFISRTLSQILLVQTGLDVTTALRVKIYRRIMKAPTPYLENIGTSRLMATVTTDVQRVVSGASNLPDILISAVSLIATLGYLLYLNMDVFFYSVAVIIFGSITYMGPMYFSGLYYNRGRESIDKLHEGINGLLYGSKELKINSVKRKTFFADHLLKHEYSVLHNEKRGQVIVTAAINYGNLISFLVIGFISFVFISYNAMPNDKLAAVIMAMIYLNAPIAVMLNSLTPITMANISLNAINHTFAQLPEEEATEEVKDIGQWDAIRVNQAEYHYHHHDGVTAFILGPLDLTINKGEITFIVGGNGSGKSTLSKMLSLYYPNVKGEIKFGDTVVNEHTLNSCRETISAIFTDYHLFSNILTEINEEQEQTLKRYLKELKLDSKVSITDGRFSTLSLSDGQKKRLALLVTFLEDKQMYLFDEWAADQDPVFKEVFYYNILPELKAKGKAVLVISHDDRYFSVADKVITLEDGKVKSTVKGDTFPSYETRKELVEEV